MDLSEDWMGWRESCAGIVSRLGKWGGGGTGDDGPGEGRGLLGQSVRCWGGGSGRDEVVVVGQEVWGGG